MSNLDTSLYSKREGDVKCTVERRLKYKFISRFWLKIDFLDHEDFPNS
jgi:hypothetical protein